MILKEKINILDQDILIKFKNELIVIDKDKETGKTIRDECNGCFVPDKNIIYLRKDLSKSMLDEIFIHELLECILSILDIKIKHENINRISAVLYSVLKRNKLLKSIDYKLIPTDIDGEII